MGPAGAAARRGFDKDISGLQGEVFEEIIGIVEKVAEQKSRKKIPSRFSTFAKVIFMALMDVKPTRSELIKLKRAIKLAQSGHKLLKKKRDGLILEFFAALKDAKDVRTELNQKFLIAYQKLQQSIALDGIVEIKTLSLALKEKPAIQLEVRNVMGVQIPSIRHGTIRKTLTERGYGLLSSSIRQEEMARAYEDLLESIVSAAEIETKLRNLLLEIERTKRRVNSLEFVLIPRLKSTAEFISFRLEELDRENIFRLKKIKEKISV